MDLGIAFVLISDVLNIKPGFEKIAIFFPWGLLCPFKYKSFSK